MNLESGQHERLRRPKPLVVEGGNYSASGPIPERKEVRLVTHVPELEVFKELIALRNKVDIFTGPVTVEFIYGDDQIALADYQYAHGRFHFLKSYDLGIDWPDSVDAEGIEKLPSVRVNEDHPSIPAEPPPPPTPPGASPPPEPPPPTSEPKELVDWEVIDRFNRLVYQVDNAQKSIEVAKMTGQRQAIPEQERRLEIGLTNLVKLLTRYSQLKGMPLPEGIRSLNMTKAADRAQAREWLLEVRTPSIPAVERGKRAVATLKADVAVELQQPVPETARMRSAVRPALRTTFSDLMTAQRDLQRMNNQSLFAQFQNAEARQNNLLRLRSTRSTLEAVLRRFQPAPGVSDRDTYDFLGLVNEVISASNRLEQGSQRNGFSRWWNQETLKADSLKIIRGLKAIDQFLSEHPGMI